VTLAIVNQTTEWKQSLHRLSSTRENDISNGKDHPPMEDEKLQKTPCRNTKGAKIPMVTCNLHI